MKILFLALVAICIVSSATAADQCEACKKFVNFISNVTHSEDARIKAGLIKLCSDYNEYLPGNQSKIWCEKAVDAFFNVTNKSLNATTVCYDIRACTDNQFNGIRYNPMQNIITNQQDCDFCTYIATKVKEMLSGGPTELEVKTFAEETCHYLQSFEKECLNLMDQYVDEVFDFIKNQFQPVQLCKSLKVCAARTGPLKKPEVANPMNMFPSASELINILPLNMSLAPEKTVIRPPFQSINCDICKKIVKIIQRQLQDNATDQQIVHVLTEVCEILPSSERNHCTDVVRDYSNRLIQVLTQDIDSNMACTLVGLCIPQSIVNIFNSQQSAVRNGVSTKKNVVCVECQLITHFIQDELYNYKNEQQIEEFVMHHFCNRISMFINESSCNTFIQEYGPIILQTIAQEVFDPTVFCFKEIHVCTKPNTASPSADKMIVLNNADKRCEMCKDIIGNLKQVKSFDQEMDELISNSCSKLPKVHSVECGLMMRAFAPYFFDMLNHQDNAQEICKSIDICMTPGHVHLLGGHKCTFGPSYWCHTVDHANSCNAATYCRQKVWKPII